MNSDQRLMMMLARIGINKAACAESVCLVSMISDSVSHRFEIGLVLRTDVPNLNLT